MADTVYEGQQYKLRAGPIMDIGNQGAGNFVIHTFMAEVTRVQSYTYTTLLPASTDFRGQGGSLVSASFSRIEDASGEVFSGQKIYNSEYIEEDTVPGII